MPQKNQIVELIISDMTHEGSGIGHLDGMAVFVPGSAVGDRLRVRLVKVNKTHCYGRIEQVATPSSDRIKPDCPVSQRCGGCVFRHISYAAELRHKQAFVQSNLQRIGGISIDLEPIEASPLEFLTVFQSGFQLTKRNIRFGCRRAGWLLVFLRRAPMRSSTVTTVNSSRLFSGNFWKQCSVI